MQQQAEGPKGASCVNFERDDLRAPYEEETKAAREWSLFGAEPISPPPPPFPRGDFNEEAHASLQRDIDDVRAKVARLRGAEVPVAVERTSSPPSLVVVWDSFDYSLSMTTIHIYITSSSSSSSV